MSTTVSNIKTKVDQFIRDDSTDSVTDNDRYTAMSVAVQELMTQFGFDQTTEEYNLDFLDGIWEYDITTDVSDFSAPVDLQREEGYQGHIFTRKSMKEIRVEIDNSDLERSFAIERYDGNTILLVNLQTPRYSATLIHGCDDVSTEGTWTADTSTSDATNVTADDNEYKKGSGSINFDIDVSQSGNDKATIYNDDITAMDFSDEEDLASLIAWVYIPDVTNFTSVTGYWGSSDSAYWSATVTTDYTGNSFSSGWNRIKIDWEDTTATGSPDSSAVTYLAFDFNYEAGQGDDTDFRLDYVQMIRPEKLRLLYNSWDIGEDTDGTAITAFTATTDVPFYSGQYDFFDNFVARRAASILFDQMGLSEDSLKQNQEAEAEKARLIRKFPTSVQKEETRNFKVKGIRFPRKGRRRPYNR